MAKILKVYIGLAVVAMLLSTWFVVSMEIRRRTPKNVGCHRVAWPRPTQEFDYKQGRVR